MKNQGSVNYGERSFPAELTHCYIGPWCVAWLHFWCFSATSKHPFLNRIQNSGLTAYSRYQVASAVVLVRNNLWQTRRFSNQRYRHS
jgi:hypothetical protein